MNNTENINKVEELALALVGASVLRGQFENDLKTVPEGTFVPRPSMLNKMDRTAKEGSQWLQDLSSNFSEELTRRAQGFQNLAPNTSINTPDLAVRSMWLEMKLTEGGAIYGDRPFNFIVTDFKLPRQTILDIQQAALTAFSIIKSCQPINTPSIAVEQFIDQQGQIPNGARVDIILTKEGPKVIEANMQWIDGIQALETFQTTYLGMPQKAVEQLAGIYRGKGRLAILDITRGIGSRSSGAKFELQALGSSLENRFSFSEVEVFDPRKVLPDYLREFDGFYINGEPRMIPESIPDWLKVIIERSNWRSVFPIWRPSLDRKRILIEASEKSSVFTPTMPFSKENLSKIRQNWECVVVKSDGYSSNNVGVEGTNEFDGIVSDANLFPDEFVIQPRLESVSLDPMFCFETSTNQPIYLPKPRSKFNVWIINGKVVGILASVSDRLVISDKDFNVTPKSI